VKANKFNLFEQKFELNTLPGNESFDLSAQIINDKSKSEIWIARLVLIVVSAFYGTNFACVKILGDALNPGVAASLRFTLAALLFLPFLIKVGKSNQPLILGGLEVGAYCAVGYWAQAISLQTSNASTAAFICSLAVLVVPIIDSLFDKNKSFKKFFNTLIPAFMAASGVACLELGGATLPGIGDLWAFLQPLFFGIGFWRVEKHMKICKLPGETEAFTCALLSIVAIFSIVWTSHDFLYPLLGDEKALHLAIQSQIDAFSDWRVPVAIGWTGIVTTALTIFGENIAMKKLTAVEGTVIYSTEPLWGTAFAAVSLGEQVGLNTLVGALLIISACIWSSIGANIISILSPLQLAATSGEAIEEVSENIGVNISELMMKLQETNSIE
jgi:drug/metabolite transporter (DMT)-like permease